MKEITLLLQLAHGAANGCWRHAQAESAGNGLAARRFRGLDVRLHDGLEHAQLALGQLVLGGHPTNLDPGARTRNGPDQSEATSASSLSHPSTVSLRRPSETSAQSRRLHSADFDSGIQSGGTPSRVRSPR